MRPSIVRIFILGPLTQSDEVKEWAGHYASKEGREVRYTKEEQFHNYERLLIGCFEDIMWADIVYIVPEPDGTIRDFANYEKTVAETLGKRVEVLPVFSHKRNDGIDAFLYAVSNILPNATRKRFGLNPIPEYKDKIYIIGSISQSDMIEEIANYYIYKNGYKVRYVKPQPDKTIESLILECFKNIMWADRVYIVPKPDGTLGEGVTYEKVFANVLNKRIEILSNMVCITEKGVAQCPKIRQDGREKNTLTNRSSG